MDISKADSKNIDIDSRDSLLAHFGVNLEAAIATGTEAEVYALDEHKVLKIYAGSERLQHFETLKSLYDNLDLGVGGITTPRILDICVRGEVIALVETRIVGIVLEDQLAELSGRALNTAEDLYLDAADALKSLKPKTLPDRFMLFDPDGSSSSLERDFSKYYADSLEAKIGVVREHFNQAISSFDELSSKLVSVIREQSPAPLSLVHGDFFPGNVLVDTELRAVKGVIDFGSFTLFGDHLLDMAGAFSYYQMYNENRSDIRARMLPKVVERIGESMLPRFHRYVLANAILTSDLYVEEHNPLDNGHFQWALSICSENDYWDCALS